MAKHIAYVEQWVLDKIMNVDEGKGMKWETNHCIYYAIGGFYDLENREILKMINDKPKHKMTRKEAIACFEKHMPMAYGAPSIIDFYVEAGMLEIVEENFNKNDVRIIEFLQKSGISGSIVMMELDRAGLKIVEK